MFIVYVCVYAYVYVDVDDDADVDVDATATTAAAAVGVFLFCEPLNSSRYQAAQGMSSPWVHARGLPCLLLSAA